MNACRIVSLIRNVSRFSLQRIVTYSSFSSTNPRFSSFLYDDTEEGGSAVYQYKLKSQRPTTIEWQHQLKNSVSFIGSVDRPLQISKKKYASFGVYTLLKVKNYPDSNRAFRILLKMWNEMAEMCIKHLKPNDFIYVSGCLGSYTKADENGDLRLCYEVTVKELNYVSQRGQGPQSKQSEESQSEGGESGLVKYKNRLYLWQVFLTNPYEWWDNRKNKVNPRQPDFRHKDTGEALWLNKDDPLWIRRQLQLLDSKMAEQGQGEVVRTRSHVSTWVYDE